MGTKVSVTSSVFNMAGDEANRARYLQNTVLGGVLSPNVTSMGEHIARSYITGPGIRFRSFGKWVRSDKSNTVPRVQNYNEKLEFKSSTISLDANLDFTEISAQIPLTPPDTAEVFTVTVDRGLYEFWADKWVYENKPEMVNTDWAIAYDKTTNTITITFTDASVESFIPTDMFNSDRYIFIKYRPVTTTSTNNITNDPTVSLDAATSFPDMTGWEVVSLSVVPTSINLTRTVQIISSYSDNRPDDMGAITTTSASTSYDVIANSYKRNLTVKSANDGVVTNYKNYQNHIQSFAGTYTEQTSTSATVTIAGGVTRTDTTITNQEYLNDLAKSVETSYEELNNITYGNTGLYIYRYQTGNIILDNIIGSEEASDSFLPFIPIYIDNKFLSKTNLPIVFSAAKNAYRRATGGQQLSKIISRLKKNESLPDIDNVYCVFGVSLNVVEMACKEYLFAFFDYVSGQYSNEVGSIDTWAADADVAKQSQLNYSLWLAAQGDTFSPLNGTPPPTIVPYPTLPNVTLRIYSSNPLLGFDQSITWSEITKETIAGLGKPTAKVKDYWIEKGATTTVSELTPQTIGGGGTILVESNKDVDSISIFFQVSLTEHQRITVYGLKHKNVVFDGHSVETTATQALDDENESSFIIPLHEAIYKKMPLVSSTQMTTACSFLIFNSYVVTKVRWYQTGFFRLIITIAAIAIAASTAGTSLGATSGILGTNASVGVTVGFAAGSTAAAIAGATLNAVAALVVFNIVSDVAVKILGPEAGAILAAVAMIMLQNPGMLDSFGSSLSTGFSQLLRADNMLKLTDAVGKGMQAANVALADEMQKDVANYNAQASSIKKQFNEQFGDSVNFSTAPYLLNQTSMSSSALESLDSFISRTLLSGTDIASLSQTLLSDFATVTLDLANS